MHTASVKELAFPTDNKELKLMEFCLTGHLSYVKFNKVASWGHSYLITRIASLRLYADDTTTYTSATNTMAE